MKKKILKILSIIILSPILILSLVVLGVGSLVIFLVNLSLRFLKWLRTVYFFRWFIESFRFRKTRKALLAKLSKKGDSEKIYYINEILEEDYWFWDCWFGRKIKKILIKELEKLK